MPLALRTKDVQITMYIDVKTIGNLRGYELQQISCKLNENLFLVRHFLLNIWVYLKRLYSFLEILEKSMFQNFKPEFSVEWRNLRCYSAFMILSFNFQAEYNKDQHHITLELSVKDLEVSLQIIVVALFSPFLTLIAALKSLFLASTQHSADYRNLRKDTDPRPAYLAPGQNGCHLSIRFASTTLPDWLETLAQLFHSIKSETKTPS